jgi:hypothetical protein
MAKIRTYIYEVGKEHPVAAILEGGRLIDLDPWDVEEMKNIIEPEREERVEIH